MHRRRWMFIGFMLGYVWLLFRPARKSIWSVVKGASGQTLAGAFEKGLRELIYGNVETPEEPTGPVPISREVVFRVSSKEDADAIIEQMKDILEEQGVVLVGDLYNMTGTTRGPANRELGWTSLEGTMVVNEKGNPGWRLKFPPPRPV